MAEQDPQLDDAIFHLVLDFPEEIRKLTDVRPTDFGLARQHYLWARISNYWHEHGKVPSRDLLWRQISRELTVDTDGWEEIEAVVKGKSNPRDVPGLKADLDAWWKRRHYGRLFSTEAIEAYNRGDYDFLTKITASKPTDSRTRFQSWQDLDSEHETTEWVIPGILAASQPMIVGGPPKAMKTSIICDLAASIAAGGKFLGEYPAEQRCVAFISGESGKDAIKTKIRTIKHRRSLSIPTDKLYIKFRLPKLSNEEELLGLQAELRELKVQVLILDPIYLALLAGSKASAGNILEMGPIFMRIGQMCEEVGCTPILVHHFNRKNPGFEKPNLMDLTMAGAAEYARQWMLVKRRAAYSCDGFHNLWFEVGGNLNSKDLILLIQEGNLQHPDWSITIQSSAEIEQRRQRTKSDEDLQEIQEAIAELTELHAEFPKRMMQDRLRTNNNRTQRLLDLACDEGLLETLCHGKRLVYRVPISECDGATRRATKTSDATPLISEDATVRLCDGNL
jgi:AAA domain-containing protein